MATERDDADLARAAQAGDHPALAQLAERHAGRLLRFLTTMTGDHQTAEDLGQDAMQRAFASLDQLRDPARFGSWLLSIACNRCRSHLRAEVQHQRRGDLQPDELAASGHSPLSSLVRREDAARVLLAVDRLPILLREAFVLYVVEGLAYREIAAVTEVAEGTLQVRVHRAKALLQQQLGPLVDTFWRTTPSQ